MCSDTLAIPRTLASTSIYLKRARMKRLEVSIECRAQNCTSGKLKRFVYSDEHVCYPCGVDL